jgi:hypothetical protein
MSSNSILDMPPRTVGLKYLRSSLNHSFVASARSSPWRIFASSWFPASASAAARSCKNYDLCVSACFRILRILF